MSTETERLVEVEELAALLVVSHDTVHRLARQARIPGCYKIVTVWRFNVEEEQTRP